MFDKIRHKSIKVVVFQISMSFVSSFIADFRLSFFLSLSVSSFVFILLHSPQLSVQQRLSGFRMCNSSIKWFPEKKNAVSNIRLLCNMQCINQIFNVNIVCIFALQCCLSSDFRRQSYFFSFSRCLFDLIQVIRAVFCYFLLFNIFEAQGNNENGNSFECSEKKRMRIKKMNELNQFFGMCSILASHSMHNI